MSKTIRNQGKAKQKTLSLFQKHRLEKTERLKSSLPKVILKEAVFRHTTTRVRDIVQPPWLEDQLPRISVQNFQFIPVRFYDPERPRDVLPFAVDFAVNVWKNEKTVEGSDLGILVDNLEALTDVLANERHRINDMNAAPYLEMLSKLLFHLRHDVLTAAFAITKGQEVKLQTDADLTRFGITQTPDLCLFDEIAKTVLIVETSISTSAEKTLFQKGGSDVSKYASISTTLEAYGYETTRLLLMLDTKAREVNHPVTSFSDPNWQRFLQVCEAIGTNGIFTDDDGVMGQLPDWMEDELMILTGDVLHSVPEMSYDIIDYTPQNRHVKVPFNYLQSYLATKPQNLIVLSDSLKRSETVRWVFVCQKSSVTVIRQEGGCTTADALRFLQTDRHVKILKYLYISVTGRGRAKILKYVPKSGDGTIIVQHSSQKARGQEHLDFNPVTHTLWPGEVSLPAKADPLKLPRFPDRDKIEEDILREAYRLETSGRRFLVDNKLDDSSVLDALDGFKDEFMQLNKVEGRVAWVSPLSIYPIFDYKQARSTQDRDLNSCYENTLSGQFESTRHCPVFQEFENLRINRGLGKKRKIHVDPELYATRRTLSRDRYSLRVSLEFENPSPDAKKQLASKLVEVTTALKEVSGKIAKAVRECKQTEDSGVFTIHKDRSWWQAAKPFEYFNWEQKSQAQSDKIFDGDYGVMKDASHYLEAVMSFMNENSSTYPLRNEGKMFEYDPSNDLGLFRDLNLMAVTKYKSYADRFSRKNYMCGADFAARLSYTLTYLSQTTHNGEEVMFDNLGFENVLLMVRGGKKIHQLCTSRSFRLLLPFTESLWDLLTLGRPNHSYTKIVYNANTKRESFFVLTPWAHLHEKCLQRGLTMPQAFTNYGCVYIDRLQADEIPVSMQAMSFSPVLALHGRRETEASLHNLRYSIVNQLAEYTALGDMLPDLAMRCKDPFQRALMESFMRKYHSMYQQLQAGTDSVIDHLFMNAKVKGDYALSMLIYSTYLMPKSPTSQRIDQVRNLKSVMSKHADFINTTLGRPDGFERQAYYDYSQNPEDGGQTKQLCKDNFMYSSKMSYMVGNHFAEKLLQENRINEINEAWSSTLNNPWIQVANSSGMRYKGKEFFGSKGHFVVTEEALKVLGPKDIEELIDLIKSPDSVQKAKAFRGMNLTYLTRIHSMITPPDIIFHIVDKDQRGGGREIYVMDLDTKTLQQPIESFLKEICKLTENEYITVPSNARLAKIHSKLFERKEADSAFWLYATLDCKRWAPQSNINKYILFILGMAPALPNSFVKYFLAFFGKYFRKTVHTSIKTYEAFANNLGHAEYLGYFKISQNTNSVYFEMPYSFVMGIFNFLSSLMHAANIEYCNYLIPKVLERRGLNMYFKANINAHSDDSAGRFEAMTQDSLILGIKFYEIFLALCNHNLSLKKCNLSKVYFEFLSILYLRNRLVPLVGKFISNLEYEPSDKGPSGDMGSAVSGSIAMMSMGATFEEAFLKKVLYTGVVRDIYKLEYRNDLIPNLFGTPSSHVFLDLIAGTSSDYIRLYHKNPANVLAQVVLAQRSSALRDDFNIPMLSYKPKVSLSDGLKRQKLALEVLFVPLLHSMAEQVGIDNLGEIVSLLAMSSEKHLLTGLLRYFSLYETKSYTSSLMYENKTRKITRALQYVSQDCISYCGSLLRPRNVVPEIMKTLGLIENKILKIDGKILDLNDTSDPLSASFSQSISEWDKFTLAMHCETLALLGKLDLVSSSNVETVRMTTSAKPVKFIYSANNTGIKLSLRPNELLIEHKYPQFFFLTMPYKTSANEFTHVLESFPGFTEKQIVDLLPKFSSRSRKEYDMYAQVQSDHRLIHDIGSYLTYIMENQSYHRMLTKITYNISKMTALDVKGLIFDKAEEDFFCKQKTYDMVFRGYSIARAFRVRPLMVKGAEINIAADVLEEPTPSEFINQIYLTQSFYNKLGNEVKGIDSVWIDECPILYTWIKRQAKIGPGSWIGRMELLVKIGCYRMRLICVRDCIVEVVMYQPIKSSFTSFEQRIWGLLMDKVELSRNMSYASEKDKYYFGRHEVSGMMGYYKGRECSTVFETVSVEGTFLFDRHFISPRVEEITTKRPFKTFFSVMNQDRAEIKLYGPKDLFKASPDLKGFLQLNVAEWEMISADEWFRLIDGLIDLGIYNKQFSSEDFRDSFLSSVPGQVAQGFVSEMEKELNTDVDCLTHLEENLLQGAETERVKEILRGQISQQSLKSKGYSLLTKTKMNRLLETMDVDPETLPGDIKATYIEKSFQINLAGRMDEYLTDLCGLLENQGNERFQKNFLSKWGSEGVKFTLELGGTKDLNSLLCFDFISEEGNVQAYKHALKDLLACFDEVVTFKLHELSTTLRTMQGPYAILARLNLRTRTKAYVRQLFRLALFSDLPNNKPTIPLHMLYALIDAIFLNQDCLKHLKAMIPDQGVQTEGLHGRFVPTSQILIRMLFVPDSRFLVKEFISSFIRLNRSRGKGALDSLDRVIHDVVNHQRAPDNWVFTLNSIATNQFSHASLSKFNPRVNDCTKEFLDDYNSLSGKTGTIYFMAANKTSLLVYPETDDECEDYKYTRAEVYEIMKSNVPEDLEDVDYRPEVVKLRLKPDYKITIKDGKEDKILQMDYIGIYGYDETVVPFILARNKPVCVETDMVWDVSDLIARNLCRIALPPVGDKGKDITGKTICYFFCDWSAALPTDYRFFNLHFPEFSYRDNRELVSIDLNYKKVLGKYVKVTRKSLFSIMAFKASDHGELTAAEREHSERLASFLSSNGFECVRKPEFRTFLDSIQNKRDIGQLSEWMMGLEEIDLLERRYLAVLMMEPGKHLDWRSEFKRLVVREWGLEDGRSIIEILRAALTKLDAAAFLSKIGLTDKESELRKALTSLKEEPVHAHLGKLAYNVFGYSSKAFNDFKGIMGPRMNDLLKGEITVTEQCKMHLESLCCTLVNHVHTLNEYSDEKHYANDYNMAVFFKTLLSVCRVSPDCDDTQFRDFLLNLNSSYNVERTRYINQKYKTAKLRRPGSVKQESGGRNILAYLGFEI